MPFLDPMSLYHLIILVLFVASSILAFILFDRSEKLTRLGQLLEDTRQAFNEIDKQAKLIVKTDLELNKAQEELDKRLTGLDALQKISRHIRTTLDENEIYQCLHQPLLAELGFERYLILSLDDANKLHCRISFGFTNEEIYSLLPLIQTNEILKDILTLKKLVSSRRASPEEINAISAILKLKNFVITPFFAQKEILGLIIAGNQSGAFKVTEGDEELISILADQIAQTIRNARLFEQVFRSTQKLEHTVQERTRQLTIALEEVKKISQTKSEFISAVSHELRTPLTSIKGYASLLITGKLGEVPEKVKERLEKINTHSDNLVKLINDLLDIARIESGRVEMKFRKTDIAAIVENVHDLLTPQAKEKNIQLLSYFSDNLPEAQVDPGQIERIFINLINNAIKFTPEGGNITTKVIFGEDGITASVTDTGIGLSKEDQDKIFNEFYRAENVINQNVKGTGLGLTLAKKIILAHNGKIWVSSELDRGTTFYFTLPLEHTTIFLKTEKEG